jgi:hypothetical protein
MSVLSYAADALFTFRVIKYLATNPDNKWVNSYEFRSIATGDDSQLLTLASVLVLFEQNLHFSQVKFDRVLVSTWAADSKPYDPDAFLSLPQTEAGAASGGSTILPLDKALSVRRVPSSGRFGHLFFRGALDETMVEAPAGKSVLTTPSAIQAAIDAQVEASELDLYLGNPATGPLQMVMVDSTATIVRNVVSLAVGGVGTVPTDHAWFNRTSSPPS